METTLAHKAYEYLRRQLLQGELKPGERLVNRALAREIGVSFTPVREAINQLASEGLVDYVRGAGAFVRRPERVDLAQLYDLRENLEPFAASEAARHISEHELDELRRLSEDLARLAGEIKASPAKTATREQMDAWMDNEQQFHELLIRAARNRWLARVTIEMRMLSHGFTTQRREPGLLDAAAARRTVREHSTLVRLLQRRDGHKARLWMQAHIRASREHVLRWYDTHALPSAEAPAAPRKRRAHKSTL